MIPRKTEKYYRYEIPNVVTIQIDSREKNPMLFPSMIHVGDPELAYGTLPIAVQEETVALPFGDYRLKEYPKLAVFERKATQLEIYKNLNESHDRARQARAFRKLASGCEHPYLLVEASPAELLSTNDRRAKHPELVAFRLALAIAKYDFRLIVVPWRSRSPDTRRKVGHLMLHIMLSCAVKNTYVFPRVELIGEEKSLD